MDNAQPDRSAPLPPRRLGVEPFAGFLNRAIAHPIAIPLLLAIGVGVVAQLNHFQGVDWGDDFALYMRQAKAIAIGNVGEVVADNRFTVDNSGWHNFSPYAYPWGWPLIVSPIFVVAGLNYDAVKFIQIVAFGIFIACFFSLVRRRAGTSSAVLLTLVVALSPSYVGWTDTALSDLPYLALVGITFWWIDRCRTRGLLEEGRPATLVALGLLVAFAFNIRREGALLLIALAALHLTLIVRRAAEARSIDVVAGLPWRRIVTPYVTFFGSALAFHLLIPTALLPHFGGSGLVNLPVRFEFFRDIFAEQIGLKDYGPKPITLLNSVELGSWTMAVLGALAVTGIVLRCFRRPEEDGMLATYLVAHTFAILVAPYQEGRYLFAITPLFLYFALQALPELARSTGRARLGSFGRLAASALFTIFLFANARDLVHSTAYHLDYDYVVAGPETPDAQQMFSTVRDRTRPDDVVLFFRARAMTLYTDRRAIQGSNIETLFPRVDWYVMEKGSTYSQRLLTDQEAAGLGLTKVWENDGWVLWKVPRAGPA